MRRCVLYLLSLLLLVGPATAQELKVPNRSDSLRFAIIGDSGTGDRPQYQVAEQLIRHRQAFPFEMVLMMGDNLYGGESARAYESKFARPYKPLLDAGVKFYAALGNHDDPNQRFYKNFNMNGERLYTFKPKPDIRFFALDSNYMDRDQLAWLEKELQKSQSDWKIVFFHHPIYSSGKRHGADVELRESLEPLFVKYGVSLVLAGHEHFYERLKPQKGIYYFISGGAAKLRRSNIGRTDLTAKGFDEDNHFMLVEINKDQMYFQTISRAGTTVDWGAMTRPAAAQKAMTATGNGK